MITVIRCLEEQNKSLRVPGDGKKLSTELNDLKNVINQKEEKIKELHNKLKKRIIWTRQTYQTSYNVTGSMQMTTSGVCLRG